MKPGNPDLLKSMQHKLSTPPIAEHPLESTQRPSPVSQVPPNLDHLKAEPRERKEPRTVYLSQDTLEKLETLRTATKRSLTVLVERLLEEALSKYF